MPAPTSASPFPSRSKVPARPWWYDCDTTDGIRRTMTSSSATSASAATMARRRAGEVSGPDPAHIPAPPAAIAAEAAKSSGISDHPACHAGIAVLATSAPVYVATPQPRPAAPSVATVPTGVRTPVRSLAAATIVSGAYPASIQEPMLIGDVGLMTRSMLTNRSGRPRSCTSAAKDTPTAVVAVALATRASVRRPVRCAPAASADDAPAKPPKKR